MSALTLLPLLLIAPSTDAHSEEVQAQEAAGQAASTFFQAAADQDEGAFHASCIANLGRSDRVMLDTLYEVLGVAPFEVDFPEAPLVNGPRALAAFQIRSSLDSGGATPTSWLWLELAEPAGWAVARMDQDQRYGREWLFETPKTGHASDPAAAASAMFAAMQAGDRRAAERACSDQSWAGTSDGLALLYQTTQDVGLRFRFEEAQVSGDRAVVSFGLDYGGDVKHSTQLLVERRGGGWIATGFDKDQQHVESFLAGKIAAIQDPTSAFVCVERLIAAVNRAQDVRSRHLCAERLKQGPSGIARYSNLSERGGRLVLPKGGLEIVGTRAVARIQVNLGGGDSSKNILWLLEFTPSGWRLMEETEIPDRAGAFLDVVAATPR